jgi:trans-2,3-dihydro-3-hydroxyanthranilate isomerase
MAASYDFVQLDVFTQTPLAGNPLAVFTDARGLTDKQMQALSREMNLSETTFILPREPEVEAMGGESAFFPPAKNCRSPDIQR